MALQELQGVEGENQMPAVHWTPLCLAQKLPHHGKTLSVVPLGLAIKLLVIEHLPVVSIHYPHDCSPAG